MLKSYLTVAWRNLVRHRLYSFINIGGLSIGIGACLLILLFVVHEHSYDSFHQDADRIYSMYCKIKMGGDTVQFNGMSLNTAPLLQRSAPSVAGALRIYSSLEKKPVANPLSLEKKFGESRFIFSDSNFFRFFSFHLLRGHPDQVLTRPFTVVITKEMAEKYFGKEDPIGRSLRYDSAYTFEVTGIVDRIPSNSSVNFDFVASLSSRTRMTASTGEDNEGDILFGNYATWFRLRPGASAGNVETTLNSLVRQSPFYKDMPFRIITYPLLGSHLGTNFSDGEGSRYLSVFPLVAGLILLLALINYMNLATARAALRSKEVGVRKANGASRSLLAGQFYIESALYALIAFALGAILFRIAQPYFYRIIGLTIDTSFIYQPRMLAIFAGLLLITILVAGAYPSLILSSFNPVIVLYGKLSRQTGGARLRKVLTVVQFFVSVVLIISSIVIGKQLYFFRHTDTGVRRDNVLTITLSRNMSDHYRDFERELAQIPGISGVAAARYALYKGYNLFNVTTEQQIMPISINGLEVEPSYFSVLGIQWKIKPYGSILSRDKKIVLNETAVDKLHLPADPMGHTVRVGNDAVYTVAGVIRNFNYSSLHDKINGLCLFLHQDSLMMNDDMQHGVLIVKIAKGTNIPTAIDAIKHAYEARDISTPFEFEFVDDAFNAGYQAEDRLAGILDVFTILTILIACLGLFGLAAFSASRRSKEISIRKTLGAGVNNIIFMLTKDFIKLVLISILLAIPVAWYLLHRWLEDFAYKISIGWTVFFLAASGAVLLALLTVGMEAVRAAMTNPVKGLRSDY
ncbi:MAG TPA: ABC transporter permease [Puia sp.]|nr:ABC transporter permease [Puia sp.]